MSFIQGLTSPRRMLREPRTWRIGITLLLLIALGTFVDWVAVWHTAREAAPEWLLAACGFLLLGQAVITWRWLMILRASDAGSWRDYWPLFSIVSAGQGLGSILPTSAGPDVVRGVIFKTRTSRRDTGLGLVVASLLIDRYAATFGTLLVGIVGSALIGQWVLAGAIAGATLVIAAVTWVLVTRSNRLIGVLTPGPLARLRPKIEVLVTHVRRPGMLQSGLIPAVLISVFLVLVRTGVIVSLYHGFGFAVPLLVAIAAVPVLLIAMMAPVTIGGFGLREWVLVVLFAEAGSPAEVSVSVGLAIFFLQLVTAAPWIVQVLLPQRDAAPAPVPEPAREPAE